ncbi:hypothetical protein [Breznakia pachnodae]|uniref:Uncharacterized protein n=1 Tax=Breznakia pachnodae TaxID=265178 RepID=A0ABU0E4P1_9FIRM|nr:hypothetical protein [Breznakia pachnodae]MDQ0361876.1 hypothetical protein [Breznakia pachnodae]
MSYVKPQTVSGTTTNVRIIYDGGENDFSVAIVNWKGREMFAMRWNGDKEKQLGFPVMGKTPLWLVLPEGIAKEGVNSIISKVYNG